MEQITDLPSLLINDRPLIDLRAPTEFTKGAFPCAVNHPLMTDSERAEIGTCYKQQGQAAAIALGHRRVSGPIKAQRLQNWIAHIQQYPDAVLYCFRGGLRSETVQHWLAEAGSPCPRVAGGYKALRRLLVETIESVSSQHSMVLLCGMTGVGKTDILHQLHNTIDLEKHANHRGSAFGHLPEGQPSNIDFENRIGIELLKKMQTGVTHWVIEDESRMVGQNCVPLPLYQTMQQSPLVVVESDVEQRAQRIQRDYVINLLTAYKQHGNEEEMTQAFCTYLHQSLAKLKKRLGDNDWRQLDALLANALKQQLATGNAALHLEWIHTLLTRYYDPLYLKHIRQREEKIIFRGSEADCLAFLRSC